MMRMPKTNPVVLVVWLIVVALAGWGLPRLNGVDDVDDNTVRSDSDRVRSLVAENFGGADKDEMYVIIKHRTKSVDDPEFKDTALGVLGRIDAIGGIESFDGYWSGLERLGTVSTRARDGHAAVATLTVSGVDFNDYRNRLLPKVQETLAALPKGYTAHLTGEAPIFAAMEGESEESLMRSERIVIPVVLVVLILLFGSVTAALLPLALGLFAVTVTSGLYYYYALLFPVDEIANSVISMLGMGVGVDYSLFLVSRFREELIKGSTVEDAVRRTMATSGRAITVSGMAVIISLASMLLVQNFFFRSIAVAAVLVVVVSVMAVVTLLPILLRFLGHRLFTLSLPGLGAGRGQEGKGFWHSWAWTIMRRPVVFACVAVLPLGLLAMPIGGMRMGQPTVSVLPAHSDARQGAELLKSGFGLGSTEPLEVLITVDEGTVADAANLPRMYRLVKALEKDPAVSAVMSHVSIDKGMDLSDYRGIYIGAPSQLGKFASVMMAGKTGGMPDLGAVFERGDLGLRLAAASQGQDGDGLGQLVNLNRGAHMARLMVLPKGSSDSRETIDLVTRLRKDFLPRHTKGWATGLVGGQPAFFYDFTEDVKGALPQVIAVVLVLTFVVLMVQLKSILLPLKAILMNALSVAAAYGALVYVFQKGYLAGALGVEPMGYVTPISVMLLFCALFGLSMDYEVFLLSRIKESHDAGESNEESVALGLEHTAGIITGAAAIMVLVFGAFMAEGILNVKEIGFGLALSVFLDATLIRVMLVPSFMRLMGEWNWWLPKGLGRRLQGIDTGH